MSDPISTIGTELELQGALKDAQTIIRLRGALISVRPFEEDEIVRDRFNSIKRHDNDPATDLAFYAYPVVFNPTAKQREDAGINEICQVLIKTALQTWIDYGFDMATLRQLNSIRMQVIMDGVTYEIRDKQFDSQYQNSFLYVHIGLNEV